MVHICFWISGSDHWDNASSYFTTIDSICNSCHSGDTLGSFIYVPCEVIKQRMQVQGTRSSWGSVVGKDLKHIKAGPEMYTYYTGMFQAGSSIWREQGFKGLYTG